MRSAAALALASVALLPAGCIVPTPGWMVEGSRKDVGTAAPDFLREGVTTRRATILELGEPDLSWDHGRRIAYCCVKVRGMLLLGFGVASGFLLTGDNALIITFDAQGVLRSAELGEVEGHLLHARDAGEIRID